MFLKFVLPLLFLMFLVIYQASPQNYYKIIDKTFSGMEKEFDVKYQVNYDSQGATFKTMVYFMLKSAVYAFFAFAVLTTWLVNLIPVSAQTLLWIFFGLIVISSIPWGIILGVFLLLKDWWNKKTAKRGI